MLFRSGGALTAAQRFPIKAGLASPWSRPGLLLLGDAAHPMSPLRAQGLNMALRDAVVAAEILLDARRGLDPGSSEGLAALDQTVERVVQTRLPEIRAVQALQRQELARAELLRQRPWLRQLLAATAPWSGPLLSRRWQAGQPTLRHGLPWPAAPG